MDESASQLDLFSARPIENRPGVKIVSYGGGTDSTALLIALHKYNVRPDLILFADTGGEKPHTYKYLETMQEWLKAAGMPSIEVVRYVNRKGQPLTLEQNCLDKNMLPSIAYGFKKCSLKFKADPQAKFLNHFPPAVAAWKKGEKIWRMLGFNAGEPRRLIYREDPKFQWWYPLAEDIRWNKEDCINAIKEAGLPLPGKSACFFCPSAKKVEILDLKDRYPDLMDRALAMEQNAAGNLKTVKGLGRRFSWGEFLKNPVLPKRSRDESDLPCDCYDG